VYHDCFQKWERYIKAGGENSEDDKARSVRGMSEKL
jgi:hypothetical protein